MSWILRRLTGRPKRKTEINPLLAEEIRQSFEVAASDEKNFPSSIDERIQHVQAVVAYMEPVSSHAILDLGSGKGRFASIVKARFPHAHVICLDLARAMLELAPKTTSRICASMLDLPLQSGSLGGAYAIESLEHAVDIDRALDEMVRVLRPGGRLVIIDKNVAHWGRFDTPKWERWFSREDLEARLRKRCTSVSSEFISYWEDVPPDGLFLIWRATK